MPLKPAECVRRGFGAGRLVYRSFDCATLNDAGRGFLICFPVMPLLLSAIFQCAQCGSVQNNISKKEELFPTTNTHSELLGSYNGVFRYVNGCAMDQLTCES